MGDTVILWHSLVIYTLILLSLLSFSVKMTVSPRARLLGVQQSRLQLDSQGLNGTIDFSE